MAIADQIRRRSVHKKTSQSCPQTPDGHRTRYRNFYIQACAMHCIGQIKNRRGLQLIISTRYVLLIEVRIEYAVIL